MVIVVLFVGMFIPNSLLKAFAVAGCPIADMKLWLVKKNFTVSALMRSKRKVMGLWSNGSTILRLNALAR